MTATKFDPRVGDERLLPTILQNEVKALGYEGRARYLERRLGAEGLQRFASRLSPAARDALLRPPLASAWVSFAPMFEIEQAMIEHLMGGDPSQFKTLAMELAREDVPTVYQFVLKLAGPSLVLKRLSVMYSARVRPGHLVAERLSEREATGRLEGGVVPYYTCEHNVAGWITVGLELAGAKDVEVRQVDCQHRGASSCRWSVRWR
jgi:uncharacterized protein (TIGR02265 family)